MSSTPAVLVYHPDEANAYARLIRVPADRDVAIHVCATETQAAAVIGKAQVAYAWKLPPDLYGKASKLQWLQAMGAGVDWALPSLPRRVIVTRAPGIFGPWMTEYVLGWCSWVTQRMETYRAAQRERRWIGDVLPLTRRTRGLIDAQALAAMRPGAWLLNIGRGAVVDEPALIEALQARRIAGAILDVFPAEPLPPEHPLWALDNVVITPHVAGPSTADEIAPVFNDNLARWLRGRPLQHVVDRSRGY
jgi:phosphoglycerate dehydrogenase-like enzyme